MPPRLIRPAYRFATYSDSGRPVSHPTIQPSAPPAPAPAKAATTGPTAMSAPKPRMAMPSMETKQATAPPTTAPTTAPSHRRSVGSLAVFLVREIL